MEDEAVKQLGAAISQFMVENSLHEMRVIKRVDGIAVSGTTNKGTLVGFGGLQRAAP